MWWGGEVLVSEEKEESASPAPSTSGLISYKFLSKYLLQALNVSHVSYYENVIAP